MTDTPLFSTIRAKHTECLRQCNESAITPELVADIRKFVESIRLAGREIVDEEDRDYLRSLLTFWGNWVYNQTRTYPNTNLEPASPEAAAAHGRQVAENLMRRQPVSAGTRNTLIAGGILLVIIAALLGVVALFAVAQFLPVSSAATEPVGLAETMEAAAHTAVAVGVETLSAPTDTPPATEPVALATETPAPTVEIGLTPAVTATASPPSIDPPQFPTATPAATSTRIAIQVGPTPTELPGTGGGGPGPSPVGILSVQVIEPQVGFVAGVNRPFTISASFYNLQSGWELFFVLTHFETAESLILPESLPIHDDGATGVASAKAAVSRPGLYSLGVYIATSQQEIQRLQRWARAGFALPPETQYDGVILFRELTLFEAQ